MRKGKRRRKGEVKRREVEVDLNPQWEVGVH